MDSSALLTTQNQYPHWGRQIYLAGRNQQMLQLQQHYSSLLEGTGTLILVRGDAGSGKSALIDEFCRSVGSNGGNVLVGCSYNMVARTSLAPWLDLAVSARICDAGSDLEQSISALQSGSPDHSSRSILDVATEFISTLVDQEPLILILEDMHWADRESLNLLEELAGRISSLGVLLIVSYRPDELTRHEQLFRLVPVLLQQHRAIEIEVDPLDYQSLQELLKHQYDLDLTDQERLARFLVESTNGNAFFVQELLRTLEQDGRLIQRVGQWHLTDLSGVPVSSLIRNMVDLRLASMPETTIQYIQAAAVIGQEINLEFWSEVVQEDVALLRNAVQNAAALYLMEIDDDGAVARFRRSLIREALYDELALTSRRSWHRRIAKTMMNLEEPDPEKIAFHLSQAQDPSSAEWLIRSGDRAAGARAYIRATEHYEAALVWLETDPARKRELGWLHWRLAEVYRYSGPQTGLEHLYVADDIATEIEDLLLAAFALWSRGRLKGFCGQSGLDDLLEADEQIRQFSIDQAGQVAERVFRDIGTVRGTLAQWQALFGKYEDALVTGLGSLENTPDHPTIPGIHANTFYGLGFSYAVLGQSKESATAFKRAAEYYRQRRDFIQEGSAYASCISECLLIYVPEDRQAILDMVEAAEEAWERANNLQAHLLPGFARVQLLLRDGQWNEAAELCRLQLQRDLWDVGPSTVLATISFRQGDMENVHRTVRKLLPSGPQSNPGTYWFSQTLTLQRIAASLAIEEREFDIARQWIDSHHRWMLWSNRVIGRSEEKLLSARLAFETGDSVLALNLALEAKILAENPRQPLALVDACRVAGLFALKTDDQVLAQKLISEGRGISDTLENDYEHGLMLLAQAEIELQIGQISQARKTLDNVRSLLTPLQARPALERAARLKASIIQNSDALDLTNREIDILRLIAAGMSNKEAAATLFISPRTVSQHLSSVYRKIGVSSRANAVKIADEQGLL